VQPYTRADVARCWAGLASLGAALVSIALAREQVGAAWTTFAVLLLLAAGQLAWALAALARDRLPLPGLAVAVNALAAVALASGTAPIGAAVLPLVVIAAVVVARARRDGPARRSAAGYLGAVGVAGMLVAAVTTPVLAATEAGEHARPHFSHLSGR
jgi:hypothetical protein